MGNQTGKQTESTQMLNGVDVAGILNTAGVIKNDGEMAKFKFKAKNHWIDGGRNQATVSEYYGTRKEMRHPSTFTMNADEPPVLQGKDTGANPVEYLLTALSSCMTTSLVYHAAVRGIKIESVESEFEGDIDLHGFMDLDPKVRKGYQEIRANFKIRSDVEPAALEELLRKSPVFDVVTNPTPVRIAIEKV